MMKNNLERMMDRLPEGFVLYKGKNYLSCYKAPVKMYAGKMEDYIQKKDESFEEFIERIVESNKIENKEI